jgi:type II secretory pathway component PulF
MGVFSYSAVDHRGSLVRGTIAADTPRQARDLLRADGLSVRLMGSSRRAGSRFWQRRLRATKLAALTRELSTLLAVGIPLTDALDTLCQQERGAFRASLMCVRDRVAAGSSLAEAMSQQPDIFDALSVRLVEVGENGGNLDVVLEQLAAFKERSLEMRDRVLTALIYPGIVLVVSLCVCVFLMTMVVPMLITALVEAERSLRWCGAHGSSHHVNLR